MNAAVGMFVVAVLTFGFLATVVVLRHKRAVLRHEERMAVIEKGGLLPELDEEGPTAPRTPRVYLLRGMLWLFVGIAVVMLPYALYRDGRDTFFRLHGTTKPSAHPLGHLRIFLRLRFF